MTNEEIETITFNLKQFERSYYHESGHAVMSYLKKIPFDYVSTEPSDAFTIIGVVALTNRRDPLIQAFCLDHQDPENSKYQKQLKYAECELMTCLAGPISEMIFVDTEKLAANTNMHELIANYGGEQDYVYAYELAHLVYAGIEYDNYDKWLSWLAYRVERIFRQPLYWAMVKAVADRLEDTHTLTYKKVIATCKAVEQKHGIKI